MAADIILSSVARIIIEELRKVAVKQIASLWGVDDDLQQLEGTISIINSVLADAERKQVQNQQIKTWLERLEDAVYEVDDLVDKISTEALQQQVMTGNIMAKQVRIFCSTSNQFAFRYKMGQKIRFLRRKLDKIADDRMKFHLETGLPLDTHVVTVEPEEHSYERKENVIGRDYEQTEIIKRLFDMNNEENLAVIPIVGVGGLGKTTLARLVYNDAEVRKHFELVMWVNVPKVFDVKLVVKEIMKPEVRDEKTMDELQQDLRLKIGGKQFLLVLDDVWDIDSREKWLKLEELLKDGANRSRIIVTTRDKKIAHVINGREERTYNLGILNDEMAWCLFTKLAFVHGQEPNDPNLVGIGKDIVKKCGGIPLVIRTIASMLYCKNFEEWSSFKGMELSAIDEYDKNIIPILKLSYDHLPSYLKHCFGYCSLFPKNYVFDVEILINLWMAQGFIKLSNDHNQSLEDRGYQHFKDLLYRSFFEVVEIDDDSSKVTKCTMHDCMHDLATSVTGKKDLIVISKDEKIDKRTHHVSIRCTLESLQLQALLVNTKRIRTIFHNEYLDLSSKVLEKSIFKCKFLRTLDLHSAYLERISKSIGKLKHLRYLDLSNNYMKALPNSITRLQNLQTLNLSYCEDLEEIPSGITKMFNLRHLHIESDSGTTLHGMPGGLDQLTNLQRLSLLPQGHLWNQWIPLNNESFFLHHISNWKTLNMMDIGDLQHLPDGLKSFTCLQKLTISECSKLESLSPGLTHLTSLLNLSIKECPELETLSPALHHLTSLQQLKISRCSKLKSISPCLHHLASLLNLSIEECPKLETLSPGLHHLTSLQQLKISRCSKLESISPCLDHLISLQRLEIWSCDKLGMSNGGSIDATIQWQRFESLSVLILEGFSKLVALPQGLQQLTSLQEIQIIECKNLEFVLECVINLKKLSIVDCRKLKSLPEWIGSLETLEIRKCPILLERCRDDIGDYWPLISHIKQLILSPVSASAEVFWGEGVALWGESIPMNSELLFYHLSKLKSLQIYYIENLQHLPDGLKRLTSLENLEIMFCSKLQSLSPGLYHLTSLKRLYIHRCEEVEMPNDDGSDAIMWQHLQSLSVLTLRGLPKLVALPQGLQQLTTLQQIQIIDCPKLKLLPEWIGSLETLEIRKCPILLERCRDDIGDYWPLISHINQLILSPVLAFAEFSTGESEGVSLRGESIPMNSESFFYHLSKLKYLTLPRIEDLQHLPDGLKRLTSLETLEINHCSKLQSLSPGLYHLTSLKQLKIFYCKEVEMPTDDGSDAIMWQHLQSLSLLHLFGLPKLVALPQGLQQLTTLQEITICEFENLEAVLENISNFKSLKRLDIQNCPKLKSLPEGIDCLTSLETLEIGDCKELEMPNHDGSDAIMWQHLQSLSLLSLSELPELVALPQGLQQLTTLQYISISRCENLEAVLENISNLKSLKKLVIKNCPKLKSLPEGIDCLTSLETLEIIDCPILLERCREDKGDYWPKISHIKELKLIKEEEHKTDPQEESSSSCDDSE